MNAKEFFDKVVEMRSMQKAYFAKRDSLVLKKCKELEKEIDAEIERVSKVMDNKQMNLF